MSGGRLVVVDRSGRDVKRYPLSSGLATLGSAPACDIRVMLPSVCAHHATIAVHNSQTVIRNVGDGETIVNGQCVSVKALRHCDMITLGDRSLRWEYSAPNKRHQGGELATVVLPGSGGAGGRGGGGGGGLRGARRGSAGGTPALRDRALQLAIEMTHRASMPASSGGKQVAIVQPQRRDNHEQSGKASPGAAARRSKPDAGSSGGGSGGGSGSGGGDQRSTRNITPKTVPTNTTKASLWIESRKTSPRRRVQTPPQVLLGVRRAVSAKRSTPLRLAVLKKAQSAHKLRVVKIEDPLKIDHTKQAAIMLMTGHTPKSRLSASQSKKSPSFVVKKPSPVRKSSGLRSRHSRRGSRETGDGITPKRASTYSQNTRGSKRASGNQSVSILEVSDDSRFSAVATRSTNPPQKSPLLPSPKKSALKDHSKKGSRKTESIKFDLSNLGSRPESEITSRIDSEDSASEDELTLRYSESSGGRSPTPSPRPPNSRSAPRAGASPSRTLTPGSPASRRSPRKSDRSATDRSGSASLASAFKTKTLSPRRGVSESYSIVDLVSIDSDASKSVYNSAGSETTDYETPNASVGRRSRATLEPTLLGCSTPYAPRARSTPPDPAAPAPAAPAPAAPGTRRSKSLSTPENKSVSAASARLPRASRSRSRINDSDLMLLDDTEPEDASPKTSRRTRTKSNALDDSKVDSVTGTRTPETARSPLEVGTPVLSIRSLLDSGRSSRRSRKGRSSVSHKRRTIGAGSSRPADEAKSVGGSARQTVLRLSEDSSVASDATNASAPRPDNEDTVTPKSAVKLVPEAVKNKHSTAKKPQSKRSMIDDLDRSDIVKQLFNSPVKRKLSRSMTEFSRKQLFDDDDVAKARRPTRKTIASMRRTNDDSISERSETFTPERFVSPISTPRHSPNLSGIQRLFQSTPENDSTNVRGDRSMLRTHRTRRSAKNDLTSVTGLQIKFANTPDDRLSDARVKKPSPNDDLRRVSGVKSLFQRNASPKNDLTDVRGVKKLFGKSPNNDLRNVTGVKRALRNSPRNDLTDVRGVRRMFKNAKNKESSHDVSGINELFDTSGQSTHAESLFDQLVGKANVKSVYSKTFSTKMIAKAKNRKGKTLHSSLDAITNNVEEWLEQELQKRFHRDEPSTSNASRNATKEMQNLATSTVDGGDPIMTSRTRNSSVVKKSPSEIYSAHTLPIKKRSLVESSIEMSRPKLPIKKRAVVHSTPVKGKVNVTMNASELGRVSPIAVVDKTNVDRDTSLNRTTRRSAITPKNRASKAKTPQKTPAKPSPKASTAKSTPKASPKISKASPKNAQKSPPKRVTRNRKNTTSENNTKKRRKSLVISKKAPVMSPKAVPKAGQESPKKRVTRAKPEPKVETPKRTRVRVQKATVVVPKPSPKMKPQAKVKETQIAEKTRRTRKNTAAEVKPESPKESQPRRTRAKQNEPKGKENQTDNVEKPKRGRKAAAAVIEQPAAKRGRGKQTSVQEVKTRGKSVTKADSKAEEKQSKTRGKKVETETILAEPSSRRGRKNTENVTNETQPKATRGRKASAPVASEPKPRGKKVETQSSVQSEPLTRGRRTKAVDNTVIPETRGRKRKTVPIEVVPPKVTRTETRRGRKAEPVDVAPEAAVGATGKTRAAKDKSETRKEETKTRGRAQKIEVEKPAPVKATRGRKVAEPKVSPAPDKRKRKAKVEASPAKGKKPSPPASKPPPAPRAGARTRARPQEVSLASNGRSRRR